MFIQISPGITALLPGSETEHAGTGDLSRHYRQGDVIQATVLAVDPERRRLSLSTREEGRSTKKSNASRLEHTTATGSGGGLGTFADLFKDVTLK